MYLDGMPHLSDPTFYPTKVVYRIQAQTIHLASALPAERPLQNMEMLIPVAPAPPFIGRPWTCQL